MSGLAKDRLDRELVKARARFRHLATADGLTISSIYTGRTYLTAPPRCDAHHITHWTHGGPTNLTNLTNLCDHHHLVHRPGRIVKLDGTDTHFITPHRTEIRGP